jgi:hypothetical protein
MRLWVWLYTAFLFLYPVEFRREFAVEMQTAFSDALDEAAAKGWFFPVLLLIREIADLPGSLINQHWTGKDLFPFDRPKSDPWVNIGGSKRAGLLAGLPHLLFPLSIFLPVAVWIVFGLPPTGKPVQFTFWILTALVLVLAWSRGWPRWSSSWIGYGLVFLLERINSGGLEGRATQFLVSIWLLLAIFVLLLLARRDWLSSLLVVLPVTPMWVWWMGMPATDGILGKAMLFSSIGLSVFLVVAAIVRIGRWQTAVLMVLAVLLAVGLPTTTAANIPGSPLASYLAGPGAIENMGATQLLFLLFLTAPLWLLAIWRLTQQQGQNG